MCLPHCSQPENARKCQLRDIFFSSSSSSSWLRCRKQEEGGIARKACLPPLPFFFPPLPLPPIPPDATRYAHLALTLGALSRSLASLEWGGKAPLGGCPKCSKASLSGLYYGIEGAKGLLLGCCSSERGKRERRKRKIFRLPFPIYALLFLRSIFCS